MISYTLIGSCLHDINVYYNTINFSNSMGDVACYILYVKLYKLLFIYMCQV
jgi:hypothetical protein